MLRFNCYCLGDSSGFVGISIHPMLRFNKSSFLGSRFLLSISIHPMLRFNIPRMQTHTRNGGFQYILCYGSTLSKRLGWLSLYHFNTSYVTVQQSQISPVLLIRYISIHPMLRFN